jgi:hypothetical protein
MADADNKGTNGALRVASGQRRSWLRAIMAVGAVGLGGVMPSCSSDCPSQDDNNPCTLDECQGSVAVHTDLGEGHPCFQGKLEGACAAGWCVIPCLKTGDCDDGLPCTLSECQGGACVIVSNDYATPPSDGNPCTEDRCLGGEPVYWPKWDGTECAGGKGECAAGVCNQCETASDCGTETECRAWACEQGTCIFKNTAQGIPVAAGNIQGDCKRWVCNGQGTTVLEVYPQDIPSSTDPCFTWTCVDWTPVRTAKVHVPCIMESGGTLGVCGEEGNCIQCIQDTDCPHWGERCFHGTCVSCGNGILDGDETETDCGGSCGVCGGQMCDQDVACASGHCVYTNAAPPNVTRVCCDSACDGVCQQCSPAGQCEPVPIGQPDVDTCNSPYEGCAGIQCKIKKNYPCWSNSDCISGLCINKAPCAHDMSSPCSLLRHSVQAAGRFSASRKPRSSARPSCRAASYAASPPTVAPRRIVSPGPAKIPSVPL